VFLSNHRNAIREDIEDLIPDADLWREFNLMIGTPEEFQGNERDIVFMLLCLDGTSRWGSGHYQEERRFNVATSRAIKFTYVIAGGIPSNASRIKRYLRHFGRSWANLAIDGEEVSAAPPIVRYDWKFSRARIESEFENRVAEELERFCEKNAVIKLFNQVPAGKGIPVCGEKRLDFVLYNPVTQHAVAVEVDGLHHFEDRGKTYAEEHIERVAALRRAGWRIVHIPYYDWYQHGWLCDREVGFEERVIVPLFKRLCAELDLPLN
jgi:very-short-patch-repair endonuclease